MTFAEEVISQRSERQREQEWRVEKDAVLSRMLHKQIILCKSFFLLPQRGSDKRFCFSLCVGSFHPDFVPVPPHTLQFPEFICTY